MGRDLGRKVPAVNMPVSLNRVSFVCDPPQRPYHHGDLKRALIETAQGMLGERRQFTMREVARRAGVSHAAPYKHFLDKTALLAEIGSVGYIQLRDELQAAIGGESESPKAELMAAARAYIRFGLSNPSLYALMFGSEINKSEHPALVAASFGAFDVLLGILRRGQQAGAFKPGCVQGQAAACWALVHGLTTLELDQQLAVNKVGPRPAEDALAALLDGLAV